MARQRKTPTFEQTLEALERLVERMEAGDLSLEESLSSFEKGIELSRSCQKALDEAEQKIRILTKEDGQLESRPFEVDE